MRSAVSFLEFKFENSNGLLMNLAEKFFENRKSRAETGIQILGISVVLWNCNRICVKSSGFRVGAADVPGCEWKTAPSNFKKGAHSKPRVATTPMNCNNSASCGPTHKSDTPRAGVGVAVTPSPRPPARAS